ncbi:MAG: hypothetical protein RM368_12305 [Nostoc sp. DedSLP03]|nr:hypothetical protein [Nostoc sp. DedSLP03]
MSSTSVILTSPSAPLLVGEGFIFYRYFHEEPHLFSLLFECYYRKRYGTLKTITVSHLLSVIECGVWFEPSQSDIYI